MSDPRCVSTRSFFLVGPLLLLGCGAAAEDGAEPQQNPAAAAPPAAASAQELPGVDLSPLSAAQRAVAIKMFQENNCNCGCGMTIATCRIKDQTCGRSPVLAAEAVKLLAAGKPADEVVKAVFAAAPAPAPSAAAQPAPEMVFNVPAGDSYALGPGTAPVTLVTWLDYQ